MPLNAKVKFNYMLNKYASLFAYVDQFDQIGKSSNGYRFTAATLDDVDELPFMSASGLNGIRRRLAELLDALPCGKKDILLRDPEKVREKVLPQKDVTYKSNGSN